MYASFTLIKTQPFYHRKINRHYFFSDKRSIKIITQGILNKYSHYFIISTRSKLVYIIYFCSMGRVNTPILTVEERQALEKGYRTGATHAFRVRCQVILLKGEGRRSKDVGAITGMTNVSVNSWLSRYKTGGMDGLSTREGRGRKPKIDKTAGQMAVLAAIRLNRQRLQTAKAEWEAVSGKTVSRTTFRRFLKHLADVSNG